MSGLGAFHSVHGERTNAVGQLASCSHRFFVWGRGKGCGKEQFAIVRHRLPSLCGHAAARRAKPRPSGLVSTTSPCCLALPTLAHSHATLGSVDATICRRLASQFLAFARYCVMFTSSRPACMTQFTAEPQGASVTLSIMSGLRLIQFTDPHLYGSETETLRGIATLPALKAALADAQQSAAWPPDVVLVTGDLVQDDPSGYVHIRRVFGHLGMPVLCIPGNHDDPAVMRRELRVDPFTVGGHSDFGAWRIEIGRAHV